jgi:paraquat-inducible protein A
VSRLANERVGVLFTGAATLWEDGMRLVAVWVVVCGALTPLLLLGTLIGLGLPARFGWTPFAPRALGQIARAVEHWAMPEVQVLAVLVALVKLRHLLHIEIGPGFWCYVGMSLLTLLAWRSFELDSAAPGTVQLARAPSAA